MIQFINGFNADSAASVALKYDLFSDAFLFSNISPGPGGIGTSFNMFGGIGDFTVVRGPQALWCVGLDWRPRYDTVTPGGFFANQFLHFSYAGGVILSVQAENDGKISVRSGGGSTGSGTILGKTTTIFPLQVFSGYLEIRATFGTSGTWELWRNDVKLIFGTANFGTNLPDRIDFRNDTSGGGVFAGQSWANVYIVDGQGSVNNDRLGPSRVTLGLPISDIRQGFTPSSGTANFSCVNRVPPPGDGFFVSGSGGKLDLYGISKMECYGSILGVAVNAMARQASGSANYLQMFCQGDPFSNTLTNLATTFVSPFGIPLTSSYHTYQNISETSLRTGSGVWIDGDISQAAWGPAASTANDGVIRIDQFYLEKLVSLRSTPFTCGGLGSYSF